jgi:hypothetical protein
MAGHPDDEIRQAEEAAVGLGGEPGRLAQQLAGTMASSIGEGLAERYAKVGARMLADPMPTRLDTDLIDRLARAGFDRDKLRGVRVHRGLRAHAAADALGARAFAVGSNDVFFARGEFDPSTREGRAVIAHEVAHIAPPSAVGGGLPGSFSSPMLNERRRGDEDAAGDEAHETQARQAEAMVYAQEDDGAAGALPGGAMPESGPVAESPQSAISEQHLEQLVLGMIKKMERSEIERRGRF